MIWDWNPEYPQEEPLMQPMSHGWRTSLMSTVATARKNTCSRSECMGLAAFLFFSSVLSGPTTRWMVPSAFMADCYCSGAHTAVFLDASSQIHTEVCFTHFRDSFDPVMLPTTFHHYSCSFSTWRDLDSPRRPTSRCLWGSFYTEYNEVWKQH